MDEERIFRERPGDGEPGKMTIASRLASWDPVRCLLVGLICLLLVQARLCYFDSQQRGQVECIDDARAFIMENAADVCVVRFYPRQVGGEPKEFNGEGTSMTPSRSFSIEGPCRVVDLDWTKDSSD